VVEQPLSPFADELLRVAWDEGEQQVPEAWWHAGLRHPEARPSEQLAVAEEAVAMLFERGLIEFGWVEPGEDAQPMTASEAEGFVQRRQSWTGDGRRVWFWTTSEGKAWLDAHPPRPVP
jgi:hypothetical protein